MKSKLTAILAVICLIQFVYIFVGHTNNRIKKTGENRWEVELESGDYFQFTSEENLKILDLTVDEKWISTTALNTDIDSSVTVLLQEENIQVSTLTEIDGIKTGVTDSDGDGIPDKQAIKRPNDERYQCFEHIETTWDLCP